MYLFYILTYNSLLVNRVFEKNSGFCMAWDKKRGFLKSPSAARAPGLCFIKLREKVNYPIVPLLVH
jgi:hypothetical protein